MIQFPHSEVATLKYRPDTVTTPSTSFTQSELKLNEQKSVPNTSEFIVKHQSTLLDESERPSRTCLCGKEFFDGCGSRCECLEVIFGKGDASITEENLEYILSQTEQSRRSSVMQKATESENVFEAGDTYDFMRLVDQTGIVDTSTLCL